MQHICCQLQQAGAVIIAHQQFPCAVDGADAHALPFGRFGGLQPDDLGRCFHALADGGPVEGCIVEGGQISLPYAARVVHVGLPCVSSLGLLPLELDGQTGSTLGKRRAYGKCIVRLHRSVGGEYGANLDEMFDIPFLPDNWGEACQPYSGDVELILPTAQRPDTTLWLRQSRPLPLRITAIAVDVDFGEV